jgi:hypothetical protein
MICDRALTSDLIIRSVVLASIYNSSLNFLYFLIPIAFKTFRSDADKINPSRQSRHTSAFLLRVDLPHSLQMGYPLHVLKLGSPQSPPTPHIDESSSLSFL